MASCRRRAAAAFPGTADQAEGRRYDHLVRQARLRGATACERPGV